MLDISAALSVVGACIDITEAVSCLGILAACVTFNILVAAD